MTAFFRVADRTLYLTRGPSMPTRTVSLERFAEVIALRWCEERQEVIAMAVPEGAEPPDAVAGERGDVRPFRWRVGDGGWEEISNGYAHDAVCLPNGGYAVHNGEGLMFLGRDGRVEKEVKIGGFNWGPPSLSRSAGGNRVAWIRWRGDDRRIYAQQTDDNAPREYGISCHRYAWLDDRSLVFYLDGPLRVLDLDTGESSTLLKSLVTVARGHSFGNRTLDRYLGGPVSEVEESYEAVDVADGRIWFAALLFSLSFRWWWLPRFSGVFSVDRDGGDLHFVASVPKQELIKDLIAIAGGSAVLYTERYRRMTVVDRPRRPVGLLASFLADGWDPLLTSCEAAFGFQTLPRASHAASGAGTT